MLYIRRKDSPTTIKAYGYVESGGLGSFDSNIYEEVQGELPEGWAMEAPPKSVSDQIRALVLTLPVESQLSFLDEAAKATFAGEWGAMGAMLSIINGISAVTDAEKAVKAQILQLLLP